MSRQWYHPSLNRGETERLLLQCEIDGTFLIRDSDSIDNVMVLSFLFQKHIHHYRIYRKNDDRFFIASAESTTAKSFVTLDELVSYFSQPGRGLACALLYPCPVDTGEPSEPAANSEEHAYEMIPPPATEEQCRLSESSWILDRGHIVLSSTVIGEGAWGRVLEGTYGGCKVAVKEIHKTILSPHIRRCFEREMTVASECRHPCLLQFIGATNDDQCPLFVTELLDTNLREVLHRRALKTKEIKTIALDVAKGLNYLHLKRPTPIIHRDISSANVLLWKKKADWRAKISDYGAADFLKDSMTACPGAAIYSAPEAQTSTQTPKVDVYSFGVLLCEMSIREQPNVNDRNNQVSKVSNHFHRLLIRRCLRQNPEERPSMADIIDEINTSPETVIGRFGYSVHKHRV